MLTNSRKILDTTETKFFQLKFFQSDDKVWQNYCCADFSSVWIPSTCWLFISVLTPGILGNELTTLFAVTKFWSTSAMRLIFFSNCSKYATDFRNSEKNWENIFAFGDTFFSVGSVKHSLLRRENTCHREPIY